MEKLDANKVLSDAQAEIKDLKAKIDKDKEIPKTK